VVVGEKDGKDSKTVSTSGLSLTRERIRQIEMKALSKMRTARHRVA